MSNPTRRQRCGFSFVELIAATAVLAIVIVPATQLLAKSMTQRREMERRRIMTLLAIRTIEEQMSVINAGFTTAQQSSTFAALGLAEIAYEITRTDAVSAGGIPDLLMAIIVKVWFDEDGDVTLDSGETVVELRTLMARSVES